MERPKFHSVLSSTAVKLSVYSTFLDFGLTASVFILQRNLLPISVSSFLLNLFDLAIEYLTFTTIGLFSAAGILKLKERAVTIKPHQVSAERKQTPRLLVSLKAENPLSASAKQAVIRVGPSNQNYAVERVVNREDQNFIRFNGVWYKVTKDKFDKVPRPDY